MDAYVRMHDAVVGCKARIACRGAEAPLVHVVLDDNRNTMQRPTCLTPLDFGVGPGGILQHVMIHHDEGIEERFEPPDAVQAGFNDVAWAIIASTVAAVISAGLISRDPGWVTDLGRRRCRIGRNSM
jgi:hypothetical protein